MNLKAASVAAIVAISATSVQAGGLLDAAEEEMVVAPVMMEEEDGGFPWLVPLIALALLGAAASGGGS